MMLGSVTDAAIKLDADENVESLHRRGVRKLPRAWLLGFRPVWALGSAGAIGNFPVLGGIESLMECLEPEVDHERFSARRGQQRRKRFPDDTILLLARPRAVAPPGTDRKPLSFRRDNFEILALRHMFALMNSWDKSPGDSLTIQHHPLRGVAYALTLVVTYRPEFEAPWIGLQQVTAITMNRRGPKDINAIIDLIVGNKFLPPDVREDVIERTDGIPLFIEEITKAVLEAESEDEARI